MNGFYVDEELILSDEQTLPNATSGDSTNIIDIGGTTNGRLVLDVYAATDITVATAQAFNIEVETGDDDTVADAASPIDDAHVYLVHKTSADGELAFDKGDLVASVGIPRNWGKFLQLKYTTDEDLSAMKVSAFVRVVV